MRNDVGFFRSHFNRFRYVIVPLIVERNSSAKLDQNHIIFDQPNSSGMWKDGSRYGEQNKRFGKKMEYAILFHRYIRTTSISYQLTILILLAIYYEYVILQYGEPRVLIFPSFIAKEWIPKAPIKMYPFKCRVHMEMKGLAACHLPYIVLLTLNIYALLWKNPLF